uniref:outer membrane protein n=1 Tax=Desulfobulbus sp. TaxID=895 RepID=UPI0027B97AE5
SAFVLTAGVALAGGPGKKMDAGCPEACQQQIDDLNSSQAQQNEQLGAHGKQLENHEGRITALEKDAYNAWYGRVGVRAAWMSQDVALFDGNNNSINEWDTDAGFGAALAFGRQFGDFRVELELANQGTDLDEFSETYEDGNRGKTEGDIDLTTVMVNGYYEIPVYEAFSVYGMAGMGFAKYDLDATHTEVDADGVADPFYANAVNGSDNVFAYKAGLGVTYNFTEEMAADLGYEYLGVADTDLAESINGHNVVASFRYKF